MQLSQLKPDKRNARRHNERNIGMIADSLREVGAARSIVIDEDGNILAGNGTVQAAKEAGITNLHVVDADGDTVVAVRRSGLTQEQKTRLALADNRTAELAEWDEEVLKGLIAEDFNLDGLWNENELAATLHELNGADDPIAEWESAGMQPVGDTETGYRKVVVHFETPESVEIFSALIAQTLSDKTLSIWYPEKTERWDR